jgi:hypothetical protein
VLFTKKNVHQSSKVLLRFRDRHTVEYENKHSAPNPGHNAMIVAAAFLMVLGVYLGCGLAFAIPFTLVGLKKIDPHAARGSWGFRLLIIPGTMAFWPLLLKRWASGAHEPPEEHNAHRLAAKTKP